MMKNQPILYIYNIYQINLWLISITLIDKKAQALYPKQRQKWFVYYLLYLGWSIFIDYVLDISVCAFGVGIIKYKVN